jgi:hypothetical protein
MNDEMKRDIPDHKAEGKNILEVTHFNFLHEAGKENNINGIHYTIHINGEDFQLYVIKGEDISQSFDAAIISPSKNGTIFENFINVEHEIIEEYQNLLPQTLSSIAEIIDIANHRTK